uniref:Uncharacterized protein n=1 Tax=Oryza meridionalis TaxID=40149 RepID=A0A0E0EYL1_9ORYZ
MTAAHSYGEDIKKMNGKKKKRKHVASRFFCKGKPFFSCDSSFILLKDRTIKINYAPMRCSTVFYEIDGT